MTLGIANCTWIDIMIFYTNPQIVGILWYFMYMCMSMCIIVYIQFEYNHMYICLNIYIYTHVHTHTCLFVYFGYSITFPKRLPAVAAIRHAISWKRFRWTHRCWRCCVTCILFLPTAHCHEKWWKTWAKHPLGGEKKSDHPTYGAAPVVKGLKSCRWKPVLDT